MEQELGAGGRGAAGARSRRKEVEQELGAGGRRLSRSSEQEVPRCLTQPQTMLCSEVIPDTSPHPDQGERADGAPGGEVELRSRAR